MGDCGSTGYRVALQIPAKWFPLPMRSASSAWLRIMSAPKSMPAPRVSRPNCPKRESASRGCCRRWWRRQRCVRHGWHRACSWFCGGLSAATGGCKCQIQLRQWHSIRLRCDRRIFGQGHRRRRRRGKSIRRLTTTSASVRPCRACDPNHHPRRAFRRRPWSRIFRQPLRK